MIEKACWNCDNCSDIMDSIDNEALMCGYSGMEVNSNGFCEHWKELSPRCLICSKMKFEYDDSYNSVLVCGHSGQRIEDVQSKCSEYEWVGNDEDNSV